jgi:CheY-like chemotaxis protein
LKVETTERNGNAPAVDDHAHSDVELRPASETVVLVAEDDPDMAELYCQTLSLYGFLVVIADDGAKAVQLAEEIAPHAICLDIRMPHLDGLGALQRIRAADRTGQTPVLMVSNFDEPELMERAGRLGAVRFLVKAETSPTELAEILRELLDLPERRKPGRLPVSLGAHPAREAEQMIHAYRELLQTATTILGELDGNSADPQRRQLAGYAAQFRAQLAYWHAVKQRAEEITKQARGDVSRPV